MALPAPQTRLEQLDSFVIESVNEACSSRADVAETPAGTLRGMAGMVSIAGKINGTISMPCTESPACKLTERLGGIKKHRTAEMGPNGLPAPPLVMTGDGIIVESKGPPIAVDNLFRVPELKEEPGVRAFAKLDA